MRKQTRNLAMFNSRKGMDIDLWFNMFELVIVFLVGFILLDFVNGEASSTNYEKLYLARDAAMLVNTIYASPGNLEYSYPEDTSKFAFDFGKSKVNVYDPQEKLEVDVAGRNYPFAEDSAYKINYKVIQPKTQGKIIYTNTADTIDIG